jgi:hypothetical protein
VSYRSHRFYRFYRSISVLTGHCEQGTRCRHRRATTRSSRNGSGHPVPRGISPAHAAWHGRANCFVPNQPPQASSSALLGKTILIKTRKHENGARLEGRVWRPTSRRCAMMSAGCARAEPEVYPSERTILRSVTHGEFVAASVTNDERPALAMASRAHVTSLGATNATDCRWALHFGSHCHDLTDWLACAGID